MENISDEEFDDLLDDALDDFDKVETVEKSSILTDKQNVGKMPESEKDHLNELFGGIDPNNEAELANVFAREFSEHLSKSIGSEDIDNDEEFDDQFADLLKGFMSMGSGGGAEGDKALQDLFASLGGSLDKDFGAVPKETKQEKPKQEKINPLPKESSLQDRIQHTMAMLNESDQISSEKATGAKDSNPFSAVLNSGAGLDNLIDDKEIESMIENIMKEMTTKEILYEPMKSLLIEYPKFFEEHGKDSKQEDMKRYEQQHENIKKIVSLFESPDSETEPVKAQITSLLEKIQECGEPPKEVLAAVGPGAGETIPGNGSKPNPDQCTLM
ncbi:hypothetical protein BB559_000442 [Furculomyces boomerangus]|uniref:Peroxin-19 n=2 Tax=Harpellales TaxID=61421 RepID=A0A2T9Z594_9FUNG|nr:hypothetical protein BB559_000442 [Furculomyces boomerangus]PVZ98348.1 hypothetical protein BB558_005648 [Smittium angustum]PWA02658.1 hypothetical protein BB558_001216 [Smittium angustum]